MLECYSICGLHRVKIATFQPDVMNPSWHHHPLTLLLSSLTMSWRQVILRPSEPNCSKILDERLKLLDHFVPLPVHVISVMLSIQEVFGVFKFVIYTSWSCASHKYLGDVDSLQLIGTRIINQNDRNKHLEEKHST